MKLGKVKVQKTSAFGDDSDESTEESSKQYVRKDRSDLDSSEFQYDEVYESFKQPVQSKQPASNSPKKPKYIAKLLESRKLREMEHLQQQQDRIDRQNQDSESTEVFISQSYKEFKEQVAEKLGKSTSIKQTVVGAPIHHEPVESVDGTPSKVQSSVEKAIKDLIVSKITPQELEDYKKRYFDRLHNHNQTYAS
ncbi:hypothetical protein OGAPHI_004412 [Ogataea philodendri]|uniref:Nuclear speckle splicing regulatory protein 1 N-terminal domain-containing protein n=1 Tax=Ogataea philodendri TaxID=1378263 RepID=A0A9P8P650_9ASCO|nr:uncharacterized protein OGAPHI_004412 [Ogataea philodendri]KAH3666223.1 hypothetical protein OGAPHI_004412 [Ogataea philodendri]